MVNVTITVIADIQSVGPRMWLRAPWLPGCRLVKEQARKAGKIHGAGQNIFEMINGIVNIFWYNEIGRIGLFISLKISMTCWHIFALYDLYVIFWPLWLQVVFEVPLCGLGDWSRLLWRHQGDRTLWYWKTSSGSHGYHYIRLPGRYVLLTVWVYQLVNDKLN